MANLKKLKKIIEEALKPGEKIEYTVGGTTAQESSFGTESVDTMMAITNHRIVTVKDPYLEGRKVDSFTLAQVGSASMSKDKSEVRLCTPGEVLSVSGIDEEQKPDDFIKEFNERKTPKKANVEVAVTMKKEK